MDKARNFDVLVIYSSKLSNSARELDENVVSPFDENTFRSAYNLAYAYLLSTCHQLGIRAAFSTSVDIVGPGLVKSYWTYRGSKWKRHLTYANTNQIFDKFSPHSKFQKRQRELLFSASFVRAFNEPRLYDIFFDKLTTYSKLKKFCIPTVSLKSPVLSSVRLALVKLQQLCQVHATTKDFSTSFVLKDRFGSGGNLVFLINTSDTQSILEILRAYPHKSFILQPFLHFDKGFTHKGKTSTTDIRLLFFNGKLVQSYIRTAPESDFRCNAHQGGSCVYLSKSEIPNEVLKKSQLIVEFIPPGTFYALDFVVSNNQNVYFLEGNMGPGIYWNTDSKIEERKTKELIGYICRDLVTRVNSDNDSIATERPDSDSLMKSAYYY